MSLLSWGWLIFSSMTQDLNKSNADTKNGQFFRSKQQTSQWSQNIHHVLWKFNWDAGAENSEQVIAEIYMNEEPYLVGLIQGLIQVDSLGCSLVEVFNPRPKPMVLAMGQVIGSPENKTWLIFKPTWWISSLKNNGETNGRAKGVTISVEFRKIMQIGGACQIQGWLSEVDS